MNKGICKVRPAIDKVALQVGHPICASKEQILIIG